MEKDIDKYINGLLNKSNEAYLMSLEIINKPTIQYRSEGFCFFICNAWELLLKAFIIRKNNDINSINFKNSNSTFGLEDCMNKVFTSTNDKTRNNLNIVKQIRNKATHLILPNHDYEFTAVYQRCVSNYKRFFQKQFPDYPINNRIMPFISLVNVDDSLSDSSLIINPNALYEFSKMKEQASEEGISQRLILTSTKRDSEADLKFSINKNSNEKATIINVPKDINTTHPYNQTELVKLVQDSLCIQFGDEHGFTKTKCQNIVKEHNLKSNQDYCYIVNYGKTCPVKYSHAAVEFITSTYLDELKHQK